MDLLNNVLEELVFLKKQYEIQLLKETNSDKKDEIKTELDKINNEYFLYNEKLSKLSMLLNNIKIREQIIS
jgi:flagellar biosynthesis chaperone FliJ